MSNFAVDFFIKMVKFIDIRKKRDYNQYKFLIQQFLVTDWSQHFKVREVTFFKNNQILDLIKSKTKINIVIQFQ